MPNGQFALYLKIHHAMVDGASAVMRIAASLDESPDTTAVRPLYSVGFDGESAAATPGRRNALAALKSLAGKQAVAVKDLYATLARKAIGRRTSGAGSAPFTAPRTPMNAPLRAGRSVATLSLPLAEMKRIGHAFGGTINDVAVTLVDAALHKYLATRDAAVGEPLVALCPLSLREAGDAEATTKASTMFVPLGAPKATIGKRMETVMAATQSAKAEVLGMGRDAAMLYGLSAFGLSDLAIASGATMLARPLANFCLSNVPGPRTDLYLAGAKLRGIHPISALGAGVGLNVTLISYAGSMDFGFVANASAMPDADRLARCTREAYGALRRAATRRAKQAGTPAAR